MDLDKFAEALEKARLELGSDPKDTRVTIQGSFQFEVMPLDDFDGKTINIIRIN